MPNNRELGPKASWHLLKWTLISVVPNLWIGGTLKKRSEKKNISKRKFVNDGLAKWWKIMHQRETFILQVNCNFVGTQN